MNGKRQNPSNECAQYMPERRAVQLLEVLKEISDEHHPVTQKEILEAMEDSGLATTENPATLAGTVDEVLRQINPVSYSAEYDADYRIKYKGYEGIRVVADKDGRNRIQYKGHGDTSNDDGSEYMLLDLKETFEYLRRERIKGNWPKDDATHSPYHIVVYQDMYYLIAGCEWTDHPTHYRIDLMGDIAVALDENGKPLKILPMSRFDELGSKSGKWDPEKYMSEHLYMDYNPPRPIEIKLKPDNYNKLHDWFGGHYRKKNVPCDDGYDIAVVTTSTEMLVYWALQYADDVEILDEEVRDKIRGKIKVLQEKYEV